MRVLAFLASLTILVSAGCVGSSGKQETLVDPAAANNDILPGFKPLENATLEKPPTLDEAPSWKQGEWWHVKLTDHFQNKVYEGTRVVVGQEGDYYLVGMPSDQFSDDMMVMHLPGYGQISKLDLSWDTHNKPFTPLRFPLQEGANWDALFEGSSLQHAKVRDRKSVV